MSANGLNFFLYHPHPEIPSALTPPPFCSLLSPVQHHTLSLRKIWPHVPYNVHQIICCSVSVHHIGSHPSSSLFLPLFSPAILFPVGNLWVTVLCMYTFDKILRCQGCCTLFTKSALSVPDESAFSCPGSIVLENIKLIETFSVPDERAFSCLGSIVLKHIKLTEIFSVPDERAFTCPGSIVPKHIKSIEIFSVYRNGDENYPSHKILLDRRTLLNLDKVLEYIGDSHKNSTPLQKLSKGFFNNPMATGHCYNVEIWLKIR